MEEERARRPAQRSRGSERDAEAWQRRMGFISRWASPSAAPRPPAARPTGPGWFTGLQCGNPWFMGAEWRARERVPRFKTRTPVGVGSLRATTLLHASSPTKTPPPVADPSNDPCGRSTDDQNWMLRSLFITDFKFKQSVSYEGVTGHFHKLILL